MTVKSEKDYITHMKESGYRSYHLIVLYKVETTEGTKQIPGGDTDKNAWHELLGCHRTFTSV